MQENLDFMEQYLDLKWEEQKGHEDELIEVKRLEIKKAKRMF